MFGPIDSVGAQLFTCIHRISKALSFSHSAGGGIRLPAGAGFGLDLLSRECPGASSGAAAGQLCEPNFTRTENAADQHSALHGDGGPPNRRQRRYGRPAASAGGGDGDG
ncbi:MAG TPA: hypothetical protein DCP71_13805, partial [Verrucomicrobiales bacterium]|nr:hypothetical protein [Verrucomicrobiales bacterium]